MSPPRRLRHCGPTNDTTPSAAFTAPSRAPATRASAAGRGGCGRSRRFWQIGPLDPQQGDVGRGIAADDLSRARRAVMGDDRKFAVLGERVLGRNNEPWTPGKASRARAGGLDRDEARRDIAYKSWQAPSIRRARRKRRVGLTWEAPLPPKMRLIETAAHLARWSGPASSFASPMLCSASGGAYISGLRTIGGSV